jgi:hypothetical protein
MNKLLIIVVLAVLSLLGTSVAQIQFVPFNALAGEWVAVVSVGLPLMLGIVSYLVLTTKRSKESAALQTRGIHRVLAVAGVYTTFFAAVFITRALLVETVVVNRIFDGAEDRHALEREIGFKVSIQNVGDSQHVLFLRGEDRKQKLETSIEQRRARATSQRPSR